jgi:hypothetical protein
MRSNLPAWHHHVETGKRTASNLGKHRSKDHVVLTAEDYHLDVTRKSTIEVIS